MITEHGTTTAVAAAEIEIEMEVEELAQAAYACFGTAGTLSCLAESQI
ncbi:thiocillin family RiPP [Kitasatospora sp. NPDC008050]